jgi:hypothetical protein
MNTEDVSHEKLMALVRAMTGRNEGHEDDEHPLPPGPWGPVIRLALERINVFGPHPEPWRAVLVGRVARHPELLDGHGGGHSFGEEVALNPQPLPPRLAFFVSVAQVIMSRAELYQEITDAMRRESEQQGITIASGYIARFSDDFCGAEFRLRWPFPGPPPAWFAHKLDGTDLVVIAAQFEQAAKETFSRDVRKSLVDASAKLTEAGLSKLQ